MTNSPNPAPSFPGDSSGEAAIAISSQEPQPVAETAHVLSPGAMEGQEPLWQALQESEERFQATFEQTAVGMAHISLEGKWLRINQTLCNITGYTKSELSEKTLTEITFVADAPHEQQCASQLLAGQINSYAIEKCLVHKNGSLTWVRQTTSLATDGEGATRYFSMVVEDINAYKHLAAEKEQLQARQEFERAELEEILRQMPGGVVVTEPTGRITRGNKVIRKILRRPPLSNGTMTTPEEWVGYHADGSVYRGEEWPMARAIRKGETVEGEEIGFLRGDGTVGIISVAAAPLKDRNDAIIAGVATFYDISEYKELERRKDEFISIASHEMKTPITTIKAFAQYLQRTFEKQGLKEPAEYLAKIDVQVNKLTRLIADLLDVSKIQAGKLTLTEEDFDINQLVNDAVAEVRQASPDYTITIEGSLPGELVGDRDRLGQVMINLLTNAIKYSPGEDRVAVQIATQTAQGQEQAVISVRDYGIGIPSKYREKIFERYYRVYEDESKTYPGLGLGLYISSEIVKLHGGKLWVESVEGQGSTFHFSVPLA
ncbi:MAG: PAS domain S-box protein [Ktedonobacteraceae bacterium]|nr:PAS domain S-box protein [Ktedonobacteraceae bacterium]